jgi:PAS domain S-box-containing protein
LEERFLQFVYQPMRDAAGAVHGILVLGIDLTDRRRAEADLIRLTAASDRRRRLYETALNNTPDLVYVFDVRHRYTYANESLLAMWGLSWDEAIGKSLLELGYEPWHAEMHDREIDRVIATKKPIQGEVPFTGTYGRRIYEYIFAPVLGADGEVEAIAGTTRDVTDRKQAEEAIRVRELRALEILESITDAFFLIDRDWCFTYVNRQAERVLERQPGDLLGVNLWEEYPGLPGSEFERAYRKAMDEEEASTVTAFYPDHQRWYEVHAYPAPEGAAVYFRNVTERVQGELALKESEERYRRAAAAAAQAAGFNAKFRVFFEQGTSFAGVLTLDGTLLEANRLSLEACGFTRDEVIGRKFWECGWWNRSTELMATVRRAVEQAAGGHQFRSESPYFVAGGGERFVDLSLAPITDDRGYVLFVAASGRDVTEQKRAAGDLQLQTDRLRLLWEAAAVLLTTDEPDAMIRAVFARIAPRFGLDAYFNFMVNDARDALRLESCQGVPDGVVPSIQRLEFGQAVCGTVAVNHRPMTAVVGDRLLGTLSFASRTREEFDADEVDFMRTICHYVTVAYERIRLVRELRDADRKKDDFIAMLAHELRNPLAPIRNGLEVLRMAGDKPAAFARARGMMERQLAHMVRLIDDLLDVSRISRNKMELRRSRVALADVISSALETVAPQLQAAGHVLNVALPGSPVYLDADLTRLAQVFGNLVSNSIKYTAPGGRIWLSAQVRGDRVSVTVRDTGIGIPQESLEHIFDMFSQVDRPFEKSSGGLGIGLALVKGLVGMHGGTVSATSEGQDRGSTFTVTLPLAPVTTEKDGTKAGGPGTAARSACKFLVVDDNADGAESMAEMLRLLGNEVVTAGDGLEAVERANAFRPEVILMDIGLPRMNGLEAAKRIRGEPWGRGVTIVACTGWGQDHDRERSRAAGCDGHLVKPVNFQDLEKLLGELLRNRNGRA